MTTAMGRNRLEAFSDGVLAIVITIMVLELKVPHGTEFSALTPLLPPFLSYVLSFAYLGIYWNNHHHMLHTVHHVNGQTLWANLHLLFWLSLVPFTTGWMGENDFASLPTALYGFVLLMAAFAYLLLQMAILAAHGQDSILAKAIGRNLKSKISAALYVTGVVLSFYWPLLACAVYAGVAAIWVVPDKRIEKVLKQQ
jgi:uncharacterized membrane protein